MINRNNRRFAVGLTTVAFLLPLLALASYPPVRTTSTTKEFEFIRAISELFDFGVRTPVFSAGVRSIVTDDAPTADQFFAGDGSQLTAAKWGSTAGGPFASAFVSGNVANFATVDGTGAGAGGISVGGLTATENFTYSSPSGTLTTGGTVVPVTVSAGKTLDLSTLSISTAAGTGFIKNGDGTYATAGGMFTGGFTINQGVMIARGVNAMGGGATNTLTINGGILTANASRDFTGKYGGGITIGGNFQLGALSSSIPLSSDSADLTFTNNVSLGASTRTITIGGNGSYLFTGVISGAAGSGLTITKATGATGAVVLTGANTYTGNTTVNSGTLNLNQNGSIANSPVIEIGGTGIFDPKNLTTALTLASGQALRGSGTTSTGTVVTTAAKSVTMAADSPLEFTAFDGSTPPLTVSGVGGALALQTGNPVTVNTTTQLAAGSYKLIAKAGAATVTGTPTGLTIGGSGICAGCTATLTLTSGELFLTVAAGATPDIDVRGNGNSIANGDTTPIASDRTDFGQANVNGSTVSHPFNIHNTGTATLNLTGSPDRVAISGTNAADFTVNPQPAASVAAAGSTNFTITFDPLAGGTRTATVTILNDDPDEGTFTFSIQGEGLVSQYRTVAAGNWNVAGNWEVSTNGGGSWAAASSTPNSGDGAIQVRHNMVVTANVAVDEVTVSDPVNLTVGDNVTLTIADGSGTDLTMVAGSALAVAGDVINNGQTLIFAVERANDATFTGNALTFAAASLLSYTGTTAQTTSNVEWPATNGPSDVTINNSGGVTLHASRSVTGTLSLFGGNLTAGANTLTLACTGTLAGGDPSSYVIGNLAREICSTGSYLFPVGTITDTESPAGIVTEYSPLTANVTTLTTNPSTLTVSVTDAFLPGVVQNGAVSRYWTVTESGDLTADLAMTYLDEDVNGNEADYKPFRRSGGFTTEYSPFTTNPGTNTTTALGVTNFSDWGIGKTIPTAASVDVAGRVVTADGRGVSKARVAMTDENGNTVYAVTNPFGYYRFAGVQAGQDYVVSVASKQYTFVSRIVSVTDNIAGLEFVASP